MNKVKTGMCYEDGSEIFLGDKVLLITGDVGEIVFECGAYGVGVLNIIDYEKMQTKMDEDDRCCGNKYQGCFNDNFVSLWELYWNFNGEEDCVSAITPILESERI